MDSMDDQGADRRTQILHAAADVLLEAGIRLATTRSVTRRAGVGTGLLNHYFRWPDLRAAAWRWIFTQVLDAQFPGDLPPDAGLDRYLATGFTPDSRRYWVLWVEAGELAGTDPAMARALQDIQQQIWDRLTAVLMAGRVAGHWHLDDPRGTAIRLGALYDGLVGLLLADVPGLDPAGAERHLRTAFRLECSGSAAASHP